MEKDTRLPKRVGAVGSTRVVGRFKNRIRFNCSQYVRMYATQPNHCYNCMRRYGYPQNLGGDEGCKNFAPNTELSGGGATEQ